MGANPMSAYRAALVSKPADRPADKPDFNVRTVDGCSWDAEGRYCRWNLPTHSGRPALSPEYLERVLAGQRARIMRDD
jgi:hypothetical protein